MSISVLAARNGLNGQTLRKQYKEKISGYCEWGLLEHAEDYLLFPENFGTDMSLDETCLSNGEVYTVLTNKAAHGGKGALAAMIRGVATDTVSAILDESPPQGAPQGKDGDDGPVLGHDVDSQLLGACLPSRNGLRHAAEASCSGSCSSGCPSPPVAGLSA